MYFRASFAFVMLFEKAIVYFSANEIKLIEKVHIYLSANIEH